MRVAWTMHIQNDKNNLRRVESVQIYFKTTCFLGFGCLLKQRAVAAAVDPSLTAQLSQVKGGPIMLVLTVASTALTLLDPRREAPASIMATVKDWVTLSIQAGLL